jgi:hypothetical protein
MKKKFIIILMIIFVSSISAYAQTGMMGGMMGQTSDCQGRIKCAEQWLKKAIDLHEIHLKDPKTATEASQMEMMDQMKKAYDCLTGPCCKMGETPSKGPESKEPTEEKPSIPHGY